MSTKVQSLWMKKQSAKFKNMDRNWVQKMPKKRHWEWMVFTVSQKIIINWMDKTQNNPIEEDFFSTFLKVWSKKLTCLQSEWAKNSQWTHLSHWENSMTLSTNLSSTSW